MRSAIPELQITARGWRHILWRCLKAIADDALDMVARSIAFAAVMGLFPMMAAAVSLYGLFADPAVIWEHLRVLSRVLPPDAWDWLGGEVMRLAGVTSFDLSAAFLLGFGIGLWTGAIAIRALIRGLNIAHGLAERRGALRLTLTTLTLLAGALALLGVAAGAAFVFPAVDRWLGSPPELRFLSWFRWPLLFGLGLFALAMLYRFGPSRDRPPRRWVSLGAVAASAVWLLGSAVFSFLVATFSTLERTYGSLAALFGLFAWIWLSAFIVLIGGKLDAETERYLEAQGASGRS